MELISPTLTDVRESALKDIETWLDSLSGPPTEEEFTSKVHNILGSAFDNIDKVAVADAVGEIYSFYKTTDKVIADIEAVFGGVDVRAVDFLSKLDSFYLSKYIRNDDAVSVVTDFLKKQYLESGAGLFGRDPEVIQKFLDTLSQNLIDIEDWQAQRIADTAVQRARNWAHISQLNDAKITETVILEPTHECDFCDAMNGRIVSVETAFQNMTDQMDMSPSDYEAFMKDNRLITNNAQAMEKQITQFIDAGMLPPYHPHCHGSIIVK